MESNKTSSASIAPPFKTEQDSQLTPPQEPQDVTKSSGENNMNKSLSTPSPSLSLKAKGGYLFPLLILILLASVVLSLIIGRYELSPSEAFKILFGLNETTEDLSSLNDTIVIRTLRLPRILLVILSGMGLALCGAAMQGVFRNPLVGPEILGVSSGASFGGVLALSLGFSGGAALIPFSFVFGCGALVLAFFLSRLARQSSTLGLVLAGIVVGGLFGALTGAVTYFADPESRLPGLLYWLMGSFARANPDSVLFLTIVTIASTIPLMGLSWRLNVLSLGDTDAASLGIRVSLLRWAVVILVSLFVAAQVAVSGGVGWVGLVIPHLGRMLVGPDHGRLLPISALLGGIYLLLMDTLARTLAPFEIPIGLMTSLVGTPLFAFFFIKLRGRGWTND
ncbi:MAG: iron ABC transporter permease [Deltaproteobacteria bacterium]|jgi:iron complex transport system permease protein|nr:iron ABC transporter permease [Deltaproteobacteria bacterium]